MFDELYSDKRLPEEIRDVKKGEKFVCTGYTYNNSDDTNCSS